MKRTIAIRCSQCGERRLRRTRRRSLLDKLVRYLGFAPYRCDACLRKGLYLRRPR